MASADDFRRIALSFPGAEERAHMGHPDFRVGGKIFATLGAPSFGWGMVKVLPEEQDALMLLGKEAFRPAAGAWAGVEARSSSWTWSPMICCTWQS